MHRAGLHKHAVRPPPGCLPAPSVWAVEQQLAHRVVIVLPGIGNDLKAEFLGPALRKHPSCTGATQDQKQAVRSNAATCQHKHACTSSQAHTHMCALAHKQHANWHACACASLQVLMKMQMYYETPALVLRDRSCMAISQWATHQ